MFWGFFPEMFTSGGLCSLVTLKKDKWWCSRGKICVAVLLEEVSEDQDAVPWVALCVN